MRRIRAVARRHGRVCERNLTYASLDDVHVDRAHRSDLVRLRLGDSTARNWFPIYLSLSTDRWSTLSKEAAVDPGYLALSMARISYHDRRRLDQTPRRPVLARSHVSLLSLRNAADPEPDQPVSAFFSALAAEMRDGMEPSHRTGRTMVLIWSPNGTTHRGRVARYISALSHHQRQPFVSQLPHHHSVSRML